jgi:hypothetical protein
VQSMRNKKSRARIYRIFVIVFLAIFVLAIAGGLITTVIKPPPTIPTTAASP